MFKIVNQATGKEFKKVYYLTGGTLYETERGAKTACTKLLKKAPDAGWEVMECESWRVIKALKFTVKMVEKTNLMSGKKYMEAEDTPMCCSPASETYWSM